MWQERWPEASLDEIPVDHVTNGIHVPTWIGLEFTELFEKYLGADWLEKQHDAKNIA